MSQNNSTEIIVIAEYKRTPIGAFQGQFANVAATELGTFAIKGLIEAAKLNPEIVDEVIMGCVLPAGLGQAPARQAALNAGLLVSTGCTTINKMCGSGLKAIMQAYDAIKASSANLIIAGGMESMTNSPYIIPKARAGLRMGHAEILDHMFFDGLEDAYDKGKLMGCFAEETAKKYSFSRNSQDEFAINSLKKAKHAIENNLFADEIVAVTVKNRKEENVIATDETPLKANLDKIPKLKPAFAKDGTVTAANSSSISDGAAAVIVTTESFANKNNLTIKAKILGHSSFARKPSEFTIAPVGAIESLLQKLNWSVDSIDLFEINEAFAVVTLAAIHDLNLDTNKVNINGGACALGHPVGASGARIVCTLLNALSRQNKSRGVASLCIGGGEAVAVGLELV